MPAALPLAGSPRKGREWPLKVSHSQSLSVCSTLGADPAPCSWWPWASGPAAAAGTARPASAVTPAPRGAWLRAQPPPELLPGEWRLSQSASPSPTGAALKAFVSNGALLSVVATLPPPCPLPSGWLPGVGAGFPL